MPSAIRNLFVFVFLLGIPTGYFAFHGWFLRAPFPEGLLQANGRIEGDHIIVASKFPGRIQTLFVREGDSVTSGQIVARLDDAQTRARVTQAREAAAALTAQVRAARTSLAVFRKEIPLAIETAQAAVAHARAMVARAAAGEAQARRDAQRYRTLAEQDAASRHRREEAELALQVASSEQAVARAALVQAEKRLAETQLGWDRIQAKEDEIAATEARLHQAQATLTEAESVLGDLTLTAPTDGTITTRMADLGEVVDAGAPLFDLVDLDRLYLKVYVPEVEIGKLRLHLPARIYTDAFPNESFAATVRFIASRAEFTPKEVQTRDERVKLVFAVKLYLEKNPDHRLTPGLPADAVIRWREDAPWTPPQ